MRHTEAFINLAKEGKLSDSTLVKMSEFKDNLRGLQKVAAPGVNAPKGMQLKPLHLLMLAGALGAVPAVANRVEETWDKWRLSSKKAPAFEKMLEYHPQLKSEDQETIARYFDSMWHFSPHMAQDPLAAGAYIRAALQYHDVAGGPTPNMAGDLATLQKNIVQSAPRGNPADQFLQRVPVPGWDNIIL